MSWSIFQADARYIPLADESVHCIVTSPPYWGLRDYKLRPQVWGGREDCEHEWQEQIKSAGNGLVNNVMQGETLSGNSATRKPTISSFCLHCSAWLGCLGLEPTPDLYVEHIVEVFREVRRVLRKDATAWVNLGDSYAANRSYQAGLKPKDLCMIPARVALALQADGWWVRSEIIWAKPNPMPENVTDRPTTAHEKIFLLTKSARYFWDQPSFQSYMRDLPLEAGRNLRSVWEIPTQAFSGSRFLADYVGADGKPYKVSEDCPLHGPRHESEMRQKTEGDEQLSESDPGISGSAIHPDQGLESESVSIRFRDEDRQARASVSQPTIQSTDDHKISVSNEATTQNPPRSLGTVETPAHMLDFEGQAGSSIAIERSNETRKTDHAPVTTQPCISFGETSGHTGDIEAEPAKDGHTSHIDESNTSEDVVLSGRENGPSAQTPDRNASTSHQDGNKTKCLCKEVKTDHFATFPEEIPLRCIKAGTSEKGVCAKCGAPWVRVIGKKGGTIGQGWHDHSDDLGSGQKIADQAKSHGRNGNEPYSVRHLGWKPSCKCRAERKPAVVLDPFSGSGTVALVADKLGRIGIGLDLKADYCRMAYGRCREDVPLLAQGIDNGLL